MDAIILCGGSGSRVSEITQNKIPKILIPILGKPFIEYLITSLLIYGVDSFHFSTGILGGKIEEYIKNDLNPALKKHIRFIECIREEVPLGTGGGLINIAHKGNFSTDYALVLNGDTLIYPHANFLLDYFQHLRTYGVNDTTLVFGTEIYTTGEYGVFVLQGPRDFYTTWFPVIGFAENKIGLNFINCGWYVVTLGSLKNKPIEYCSLEKTLLPEWIEKEPVMLKVKPENFLDIGNPIMIKRTEDIINKYK